MNCIKLMWYIIMIVCRSAFHYLLNQVPQRSHSPGFLKLLWFACRYVCVCPSPRTLITSGVIWCDIGCVRLVEQVSWLFPAFNYFILHLPSIKWMGVAILAQHVVNSCQRKLRWATEGLPERWSTSFIKVSGCMHCDEFKRRPAFSFTVTILTFYYH